MENSEIIYVEVLDSSLKGICGYNFHIYIIFNDYCPPLLNFKSLALKQVEQTKKNPRLIIYMVL